MSELSVGKVQAAFTALLRANALRSRPLSPTTLQRVREVLRAALNGAIRRGLITSNPARWVELPSARRPRVEVWTEGRGELWRRAGSVLRSRCGLRSRPRGSWSMFVTIRSTRCITWRRCWDCGAGRRSACGGAMSILRVGRCRWCGSSSSEMAEAFACPRPTPAAESSRWTAGRRRCCAGSLVATRMEIGSSPMIRSPVESELRLARLPGAGWRGRSAADQVP